MTIRWADSHCHLRGDGETSGLHGRPPGDAVSAHEERVAQVQSAAAAGVDLLVHVGTSLANSARAAEVAAGLDGTAGVGVWATAGVHPHSASEGIEGLEALLGHERIVAVGECGFDLHYGYSPTDAQREAFAAQIALAKAHDLTLVIHTREAWAETFDVLEGEALPERIVMHCFQGGPDEARRCLDLGAHLSFSGIVTFPKGTDDLREAARLCPSDRMLVETDSPYLTPVPHRGERNQPAWVTHVGAFLAELRGEDLDVVAAATRANTVSAFALPT
jgi:TatD DNase family protein